MKKLLLTLFNILAFTAIAWADDEQWSVNPHDFQYDMTAYVNVNVDGSVVSDLSRYTVAAFCGKECRGVMEVKTHGDAEYGYLRIRSNKTEKETITFKVLDNETGNQLKCTDTLAFVSQRVAGLPSSPVMLKGANKYKVDFMVDNKVYQSQNVYYGDRIILIEAPKKKGHTFMEWLDVPETMPAHDIALTAYYEVNFYNLVFKIGEKVISSDVVKYGTEIVEPDAPERVGYTFDGWSEHPATMPDHDLTVNGSYTVNKYLVTYKIDDEVFRTDTVAYGSKIVAPDAPEKEGHTFSGWSEHPETMPANDITVTGTYTVNSYQLVFKIGDSVLSEKTVLYGSEIVEPIAPEKEGYTFDGWSEHPATMPAHDLTITGSYTVNVYTVTYIIDNETVHVDSVAYGTQIEIFTAPMKEGHTFDGWSEHPKTMPAHDIVITGSYTINYYELIFKVDGEIISDQNVAYGSDIVEPDTPQLEGRTFTGWEEHPTKMPAHNVTVNGTFTLNNYVIVYKIGDEVIFKDTLAYRSKIVEPAAPEKEGHTFDGWSEHPETMPAYDLTVTGSYTVNSYQLVFKIGDYVLSEEMVEYGSEIVEPTAPEKEGYTFDGWEEHPATMPAHNVTVNGTYTVNVYTVTYMIDDEIIRVDNVEYGTVLPEAPEAPEREGYEFRGWSERPETMPAKDIIIVGTYEIATGISGILATDARVNVYDLRGVLVKPNASADDLRHRIPSGVYIINHKKVFVK